MIIKNIVKSKFIKIFSRIILVLIIIELGLRISGFFHETYQEKAFNQIPSENNDYYKIIIMGDSMSYGDETSWPRQLEGILNNKSGKIKFKVINKALPGQTSTKIASYIEHTVERYKPEMVIIMSGLNVDSNKFEKFKDSRLGGAIGIISELRLYKLSQFLIKPLTGSFNKKKTEVKNDDAQQEEKIKEAQIRTAVEAIEDDKNNSALYLNLGFAYLIQNDVVNAEDVLKKGIEIDSRNPQLYVLLWRILYNLKRYNESEDYITKLIELEPNNTQAFISLGKIYKSKKMYNKAEASFQRALEINNRLYDVYFEIGILYSDTNQTEKANHSFSKFLDLSNNEIRKISTIQDITQGQKIIASEIYLKREIASKEPTDIMYLNLGGVYFVEWKAEESEDMLIRAVNKAPNNVLPYYALLTRYKELGLYRDAIKISKNITQIEPSNTKVYYELGQLYIHINNSREAVFWLNKSVTAEPKYETYEQLGLSYLALNDTKSTVMSFTKAIEINPESQVANKELAWYFVKNNQEQDAEKIFKYLSEKNIHILLMAFFKIKENYEKEGNYEGAQRFSKRITMIRDEFYDPIFNQNYLRIYDMMKARGIKFVAVQYPLLDEKKIKRIFSNGENVIIVSNKENFDETLKSAKYEDLFKDRDFGIFGHGTDKGNRLIAESVAEDIINEIDG